MLLDELFKAAFASAFKAFEMPSLHEFCFSKAVSATMTVPLANDTPAKAQIFLETVPNAAHGKQLQFNIILNSS